MERETIQDRNYNTLGYIYPYTNGQLRATDAQFKTVGYYDPQFDITKDAQFQTVARGNVLSTLIYEQAQTVIQQAPSSATTHSAVAGGEPRSGTSKPASCSGILAAILIVVGGAVYNWWSELTHRDAGTSSITATQVAAEGDQQSSGPKNDINADSDSANSAANSLAMNRPQEQELRGAILHALDTGTPVQWEVGGKSGWINVSALRSMRTGTCRTVAATDYQQRLLDRPRTWCRSVGSDWQAQ